MNDLIDGIVKMMESQKDMTGPINLGNPTEFAILELAEKIITMIGSKSKLIKMPRPQNDPKQRKPDTALARTAVGWEPSVPTHEGLERTIPTSEHFWHREKNVIHAD